MSWKTSLFQQHDIGQLWGRFALAGTQISIFITGYTFIMVSVDSYSPVASWVARYGFVLPFPIYMTLAVFPIVIALVLSWKFLVTSFYLSWAEQFWRGSKEFMELINAIKEQNKAQNDEVLKQIAELREKLK